MNREYIQKLGAAAARKGLTLWDCPYYRAMQMPGHTGESIAAWRSKVDAWEAGWTREAETWRSWPGGGARSVPRAIARQSD